MLYFFLNVSSILFLYDLLNLNEFCPIFLYYDCEGFSIYFFFFCNIIVSSDIYCCLFYNIFSFITILVLLRQHLKIANFYTFPDETNLFFLWPFVRIFYKYQHLIWSSQRCNFLVVERVIVSRITFFFVFNRIQSISI